MAKKLADLFTALSAEALQSAANELFPEMATPQASLDALNRLIAGEANPSFERSQAILEWDKKQKKAAVPKSTIPRSTNVTTPSRPPRRTVTGMTF